MQSLEFVFKNCQVISGIDITSFSDLDNTVSVYTADGNILVESSLPIRIMSITDVLGKTLPATVLGNKIILTPKAFGAGIICFVSIKINERVIVKKVFASNINR